MNTEIVKPVFSIITVVYNSATLVEKTINSILEQTYLNIEFIIIDGGSTDGTLEIIKKYNNRINKWLSEKDNGLYDGMNKAFPLVTGDYICFLNSGDTFYSPDTLMNISNQLHSIPDVIYGETIIVDASGNEIGMRRLKAPENLTWRSFKDGMLVCHQSVFIRRDIASSYNTKYKIAADYDWVLRSLRKASSIHNTHLIISRFLDGGMNKSNIRRSLFERFKIMSANYGFFSTLFNHLVIGIKFFFYIIRNKRF
jgi:glycosyltransferase involved in cell wall biosynthesis